MNRPQFFQAIKSGDLETVTELLRAEPSLALGRDEAGATPVHYATLHGHREIVRLLVGKGADVNALDTKFGATPTGWAIEYLREVGGFLAIEIEDLAHAIEQGDAHWVARLLERFPELESQVDSQGKSIRQLARECGDERIRSLFDSRD